MRAERSSRSLPLAGVAAAGVALGHWLTYMAALPQARLRAQVLAATGHGYWLLAVKGAVVLGLAGLGAIAIRHLTSDHQGHGTTERLSRLGLHLAAVQVTVFAMLEITERLAVGAPLGELFHEHIFVFGLALQVLIAAAGALVVLWLDRAAAAVCRRLRERSLRSVRRSRPQGLPDRSVRLPLVAYAAAGVRGPPSSS
jgi:hypothetical protein